MSVICQIKRAKLHNLLESVPQEIPDELITEIAEAFTSLVDVGDEQYFLLSAIGDELVRIAGRYHETCYSSASPPSL